MTVNEFRDLVLGFPDTVESSHQGHPDFRVGGKVFATIAKPDDNLAMVKLTPTDQAAFVKLDPAFAPCSGTWGKRGYTYVALPKVKKSVIKTAVKSAYQSAVGS